MNAELIRARDVNSHTVEIVRELCGSKLFPSFELVISILYQRYGVADFCQLCCGALEGVTALVWLSDVSRKVILVFCNTISRYLHDIFNHFSFLGGRLASVNYCYPINCVSLRLGLGMLPVSAKLCYSTFSGS